jgi:hypothetical protein
MRQKVYMLYDESNKFVVDKMCDNIKVDEIFYSVGKELTEDILLTISKKCLSDVFYIIKTDKELLFPNFDFRYVSEQWNRDYVHIWNNDLSVRMYNTASVSVNPANYTDKMLSNGNVELKNIADKIYQYPKFDIVFLSYDEEYADENFSNLQKRFGKVLRVHGERGIFNAHKKAANIVTTDMFYVVDADADILPTFEFDYQPISLDRESVHVWHSKNPVNDLEYGYGGIKLFPTKLLQEYNGSPVDFSTSVSKSFKVIPTVSNITRFNTDPFSAWRSGFRECAKLASKVIDNQVNSETEIRLYDWCNKGAERDFGEFVIMGALAGTDFGRECISHPENIGCINDFTWLETKFNNE